MSLEQTFYCDWRDCDADTRTVDETPRMGFLTISEDNCHPRHFCSWDCVLKRAATAE